MAGPSHRRLRGLAGDERGASSVEYLLVVVLVGIVGLAGFRVFGGRIGDSARREAQCIERMDGSCEAKGAIAAGRRTPGGSGAPPKAAKLSSVLTSNACAGMLCLLVTGLVTSAGAPPDVAPPDAPPAAGPVGAGPVIGGANQPGPNPGGPPPAGWPGAPQGGLQQAYQKAMASIFVNAQDNEPLRAALAQHVLAQPMQDPQAAVQAAWALAGRAARGDDDALALLAPITADPVLHGQGVADMAAYTLLNAAQAGQAGKVVDALVKAHGNNGGADRAELLATLGFAARYLDAKDPKLATARELLRAGLDPRGPGGPEGQASAIVGLGALFDRLTPEDIAALLQAGTPEAVGVVGEANAFARKRAEDKKRIEDKLERRQALTHAELKTYATMVDKPLGDLIFKYLRSEAFVADPPRMTDQERARFDAWEAFPFDPELAELWAKMRLLERLTDGEEKRLYKAMKNDVVGRLRDLEKQHPLLKYEAPSKALASEHWSLTYMLHRYEMYRRGSDSARVKAIEEIADLEQRREAMVRLRIEQLELIVDLKQQKEESDRLVRWHKLQQRDIDDQRWSATYADTRHRIATTSAVRIAALERRIQRTAAELRAADARGENTDARRAEAAAAFAKTLGEIRNDLRRDVDFLEMRARGTGDNQLWGRDRYETADLLKKVRGYLDDTAGKTLPGAIGSVQARPVSSVFRQWGVDRHVATGAKAVEHYGEETVRRVIARIAMVNALPPTLRKDLTGSLDAVDPAQVAYQMANKTLGAPKSPTKFLLDPLEKKLDELIQADRAKAAELKQSLGDMMKNKDAFVGGAASYTKENFSFWARLGSLGGVADEFEKTQRKDLDLIRLYDKKLKETVDGLSTAAQRAYLFEVAQDVGAYTRADTANDRARADLALVRLWEKHGEGLLEVDKGLYDKVPAAWKRLGASGTFATKEMPDYRGLEGKAKRDRALAALKGLDATKADASAVRAYALRALDGTPELAHLQRVASDAAFKLPTMVKLLQAGLEGKKYQDYVDFVREELARPVWDALESEETKNALATAKDILAELRKARDRASADDFLTRKELDERIKSLAAIVKLLEDGGVRNALKTIMDKKDWSADTLGNWVANEGPKVLGAIAVAVAAVVTTVLTMGAAAPFWAVALATAGAGAVGAYVGYQATAEGMHQIRNNFDPDVVAGRVTWREGSAFGSYLRGEEVYDPVTNKMVKMDFLKHVALPAVKEIAISFVINLATMGLGKLASGTINTLISRGGAAAVMQHSGQIGQMTSKMGTIARSATTPAAQKLRADLLKELGKRFPKEFLNEVGDEIKEAMIEEALKAINSDLGWIAPLVAGTASGAVDIDVNASKLRYAGEAAATVEQLGVLGFQDVIVTEAGVIKAKWGDKVVELHPKNPQVMTPDARGPPLDAPKPVAQGAIRNPGDPVAEVATEYDLTPAETEQLRKFHEDLKKIAETIPTDPVAAAKALIDLTRKPGATVAETEAAGKLVALAEKAYPQYAKELEPAKAAVRGVLGDLGEVQGRAKDPVSAANRLERAIKSFGARVETTADVLPNLWDAIGTRLVLDDTSAAHVDKVVDALVAAIKKGDLSVVSINNLHGPGGKPYFSDAQLARLQQAAAEAGKPIKVTSSKLMDSGYTVVTVYLEHANGVRGELQIIGRKALEIADVEHIPYDVSLGKPLVRGIDPSLMPEMQRIVQPVEDAMRGFTKDQWAEYNGYLNASYIHARNVELGIESKPPTLPKGLPEVLSIDGLKKVAADLKAIKAKSAARAAWTDKMPFELTEPIEIGAAELQDIRRHAKEYADALRGEVSEAEIVEILAREKFGSILRANAGKTYLRDPATGTVKFPRDIVVKQDGELKPLDPKDPIQKAIADLHARAVLEELTHGAGFSVREGAYVPLSPRMADFQHWLGQPETQAWLKANFPADEVARMQSMIFEADAMDLALRSNASYSDAEIERYAVRKAFKKFLDDGAPGAPPGTKQLPPFDSGPQGAIRFLKSLFGLGSTKPKTEAPPSSDPTPFSAEVKTFGADPALLDAYTKAGLGPKHVVVMGDVKVSMTDAFDMGGGRMAVAAVVEVPGQPPSLRVYYRSNSQGLFRVLPAKMNSWFDKGPGEHALGVPRQVQAKLAELVQAGPAAGVTPQAGMALVDSSVPVTGSYLELFDLKKTPDYIESHLDKARGILEAPAGPKLRTSGGHEMTAPDQLKIEEAKRPDFGKPVATYKTKTASAGDVEAIVYPSKDGTTEYTIFKSQRGSQTYVWIAEIASTDSKINSFGVRQTPIASGALTTPLWEYHQQIPEGYEGGTHPGLSQYGDAWGYVGRIPEVAEWYRATGTRMPAVPPIKKK